MALSQNDRLIRSATPLGDNTFVLTSFTGTEAILELCIEDPHRLILMNLDTIFIEPDERTLSMVWRGRSPIDNLDDDRVESASISVGTMEQAP